MRVLASGVVAILAWGQLPAIVGHIEPNVTADRRMISLFLKAPATGASVPLVVPLKADDRVVAGELSGIRPAGGLPVAFVEHADGSRSLYVDVDGDGRLASAERRPYEMKDNAGALLDLELRSPVPGRIPIPIKAQVSIEDMGGARTVVFSYTPILSIAGHADIGGRRTLVQLPYAASSATIDVENGEIGMDTDGDGTIDTQPLSPELVQARKGEPAVFRVGDRYYSVETADMAARTFKVREHPASDYRLIEVREGAPVADFEFTDFGGRQRKLSEFRGKYVLLDFWGSWCGPCVADVPHMKEAYEKFHSHGFEIVGLDFEHGATSEKVRAFITDKGITWPNAVPESVSDLIDRRFRVTAFPTLVLLDREGKVVEKRSNRLRGAHLLKTLEEILR